MSSLSERNMSLQHIKATNNYLFLTGCERNRNGIAKKELIKSILCRFNKKMDISGTVLHLEKNICLLRFKIIDGHLKG